MIPYINGITAVQIKDPPTRTYQLHLGKEDEDYIAGYVDGLEAMKQAVYLRISIERYKYPIYDWNLGIETEDLFGMPIDYCVAELPRRFREALSGDNRITSVSNFKFTFPRKGIIYCAFTVYTIFGELTKGREVRVA